MAKNNTLSAEQIEKTSTGGIAASSADKPALELSFNTMNALGSAGLHQTQDKFAFSDNGTMKSITFSNLQDAIFADVSGDATIAAGGALTIAAGAVENSMLADDAVGADELAANAVVNASIASNAAIDMDKLDGGSLASSLSDLAQGDLLYAGDVDDSNSLKSITFSNLEDAIFGNVSGDITIGAGGTAAIGSGVIVNADINSSAAIADTKLDTISTANKVSLSALDIDGATALGSATVAQADLLVIDDGAGGTNKKVTFSNLEDSIFGNISGDATIAAGGALTISSTAVEVGMLHSGVVDDSSLEFSSADAAPAEVSTDVYNIVLETATTAFNISVSNGASLYPAESGFSNAITAGWTVQGYDSSGFSSTVSSSTSTKFFQVDVSSVSSNKPSSASDFASYRFRAVGSDFQIADGGTGAIQVKASGVTNDMLAGSIADSKLSTISTANKVSLSALDIDGATALGGATVAQADLLVIDDGAGGTNKKVTFSNFEDSIFGNVSGDATIAAGGALTIGSDAVEQSMIADDAVGADQLAANAVVFASVATGAYTTDLGSSASSSEFARADAIKSYVDAQVAGLDVKASVAAAYPSSFTMASTASTSTLVLADGEGGFSASADTLTVDGVSVSAGARVLVKEGVNSNSSGVNNKWNGVYTVGALNGSSLTLTRATDFDAGSEFIGAPFFMVDAGTTLGAHGFVSNLTSAPTIGTDAITFYQFSAPGQDSVAGAGIAKSGNVLSVDIDELSALGGATLHQTQDHFMVSDNGTEKKVSFTNLEDSIFGNVSGDATIAAGGALTIANDAVEQAMIADDAVGADQLASNAVVNASIASGAAIDMDKLDGGSLASSLSDLAQGDLLYAGDVDDSNSLKSITFSNLEDAIFGNVSGDIAISAGGSAAISAGVIVNADINSSAAIADTKLDTISTAGKVSLSALEIDGGTDIGAALVDADLFIVDDGAGGTNRKSAMSRVATYIGGKLVEDTQTGSAVSAGGNLASALSATPVSDASVAVYFNGLLQTQGVDYTISGTTVTLAGGNTLSASDRVVVKFMKA